MHTGTYEPRRTLLQAIRHLFDHYRQVLVRGTNFFRPFSIKFMLLIPISLPGDGPEPGLAIRNEEELCKRKQSAGQPLIYRGQPATYRTYSTSHKVHISRQNYLLVYL